MDPALIFAAIQTLCGHPCPLPFVRSPVLTHPTLSTAITNAFASTREPLAMDSLVVQLAEGLLEADPSCRRAPRPRYLDVSAVHRARAYLDAHNTRVVRSAELEAVTGLIRYDLARQFRALCGTSPYRYALLRRLAACLEARVRNAAISLLLHPELANAVPDALASSESAVAEALTTLVLATLYLRRLWYTRLRHVRGTGQQVPEGRFSHLWSKRRLPPPAEMHGELGLCALADCERRRRKLSLDFVGDWQDQVAHLLFQERFGQTSAAGEG